MTNALLRWRQRISTNRTPASSCWLNVRLWHLAVPEKDSNSAIVSCVPAMENCDRYKPLLSDAIQLLPAATAQPEAAATRNRLRTPRITIFITVVFILVFEFPARSDREAR